MTCREWVRNSTLLITLFIISIFIPGCGQDKGNGKNTFAFVTNGVDPFWVIGQRGAEKAGKELDVNVEVRMPPQGAADQKRMVRELLAQGVKGIAISPISPENQTDLLNEIAEHSILVTQDSDAPDSSRECYIGMDNYIAGRMCGELVKEALPDGGEIVLFVGRLGQANARLRRQGVIDEVMDRSHDNTRYDEPGKVIKNDKYTIHETRTDDFDSPRAKMNAKTAIVKYPDLKCMVGLFAYNPPLCLDAVKEAGKLDQIKIVSFDENERSLQGIAEGTVVGTIVQNPFQYGYESIRVLDALAKGDKSVIPENKIIHIPARKITKENVHEFWDELKAILNGDDTAKEKKSDPSSEEATSAESEQKSDSDKATTADE